MKQSVFGETYSDAYDVLYQDKDYATECALLEQVFEQYAGAAVKTVLDLGCGTGNHALPLAGRGYAVTGVDRSPAMLAHAQQKARQAALRLSLHEGDVRTVRLGQTFDAALMMFAVLGYMSANEDVLAALQTVREHLQPGGIFVFDVWYGPVVLGERPSQRLKVITHGDERVLRAASGNLDVGRNLCTVHYDVWRLSGDRLLGETHEDHQMRYFFAPELAFFLAQAGLKLERLGAFPDFTRDPDETTWNVTGVARAV